MKKRGYRFDRFIVFVFTMNKGERKNFDPREVTRGLTDYGPNTLNSISVFTQGSFHSIRPGRDPWLSRPGDGGARFVDCDSLAGHAIVALEDDSEYHCITPKDHEAKFWERRVINLSQNDFMLLLPGEYCYVASGKIAGVSEKLIYNGTEHSMNFIAEEDSIVAVMWNHDEPSIQA